MGSDVMNCKPGDIAIIIAPGEWHGRMVEILYLAPLGQFQLPDNYPAECNRTASWVFRFLGWASMIPLLDGSRRTTYFAFGDDRHLKPIRGQETPEAITETEELETTA
jgi:hypothetical protein